jgi:hypothetical protein
MPAGLSVAERRTLLGLPKTPLAKYVSACDHATVLETGADRQ